MKRFKFCIMLLACAAAAPAEAQAPLKWSVTPIFGWHQPHLDGLNNGVFVSDLVLTGFDSSGNVNQQPGEEERRDIPYENDLPLLEAGGEAGAEFYWNMGRHGGFIFGLSNWEGYSTSFNQGSLRIQGWTWDVANEREAKVSYTQFYVGWRRDLFTIKKRLRTFASLTLHELFDIDYRETYIFEVLRANPPDQGSGSQPDLPGNRRIVIFNSQATGGLNLGAGLGSEYFFTDWFSLGFQVNYYMTLGNIFLRDYRIDHDFSAGDQIDLAREDFKGPLTLPENGEAPVHYVVNGNETKPLYLDFGGLRAVIRMNFYF